MPILLEAATGSSGIGALGMIAALIVGGLLFLAAEVFIIPGFGVAGVIGALLLVGGCATAWLSFGSFWGIVVVIVTTVLSILLVVVAFRSKGVKKRFILDTQLERGKGTDAEDQSGLLGRSGVTTSDLRPAGIVMVDGRRLDVVSDGGFIDRETEIEIIAIEGPRVVVARLRTETE